VNSRLQVDGKEVWRSGAATWGIVLNYGSVVNNENVIGQSMGGRRMRFGEPDTGGGGECGE